MEASTNFQIRKAERKRARIRIGVTGPSGSGKTMGALLIAFGLTNDWSKILVIDTEDSSSELYSNHKIRNLDDFVIGEFQHMGFKPPFAPERYVQAIKIGNTQENIEVIIIDSISHEWMGSGGALEIHEALTQGKYNGNSFAAWKDVTPRHQAFIDAMLRSPKHTIVTERSKVQFEISKGDNGKNTVQKLGTKTIQREGFDYELTVQFDVAINHLATTSKDRTDLFMGADPFIISPVVGETIKKWNASGIVPARKVAKKDYDAFVDQLKLAEIPLETADNLRASMFPHAKKGYAELNIDELGELLHKCATSKGGTASSPTAPPATVEPEFCEFCKEVCADEQGKKVPCACDRAPTDG